ncbi:unnamed protein product [Diabrotica balteata]|uniref:Receptor ligand binding region domain-containing protein n=1 Tax=Diabrotica balteata TaxID=107213 RepID=A0A9N9TDS8_DIABA|nr:unnamed protein product [Diabrotica balteata]
MNWSYVSIIYEESNYGIKAFEELEDLLAKYSICIAVKEKLVKDSGVARESAYDSIVLKLLTKPRARGFALTRDINTSALTPSIICKHTTKTERGRNNTGDSSRTTKDCESVLLVT